MMERFNTRSYKMAVVTFDGDGSQSAFFAPDMPESAGELEIVTLKGDEGSLAAQFAERWKKAMEAPSRESVLALSEADRAAGAEALVIVIPEWLTKQKGNMGFGQFVGTPAEGTGDEGDAK